MNGHSIRQYCIRRAGVAAAVMLCAQTTPATGEPGDGFVHGYWAQYTDTTVEEIITLETDSEPSWLAGIGAGRVFARPGPYSSLEWELHAVRHWGLQHHSELNGLVSFRWSGFPWSDRLHNTVAIGTGPSYALTEPPLEERRRREATRLLQYLLLEVTAAPPGRPEWSGFIRLHHRSGLFGLVAEAGGSNFIALGLRRHF